MINIDDGVNVELVPAVFKSLRDVDYKLTKTESFRDGYVGVGDTVTGPVSIVKVVNSYGVKVMERNFSRDLTYLRTSPVVQVLDATDTKITFQTEGGVYTLEAADG